MVDTVRIGIVGAGGIIRSRHVPNLREIPGVELVSVCNRSRESSQRAAKEFNIPTVHSSWQELVHSPDVDAVWIGTWPYMHCPITLEALQAGKHVFCQARMAMNLREACTMRDAATNSDRVTMLCPPPMGMKGDLLMQKAIDDGLLGEVYSIHFRDMTGGAINPESPITWRQREDLSGFNTLTVGIYAEVVRRWFGDAKNVTAQAKTFITKRPSSDGGSMPVTRPDTVMVLSEMENGALMRWEWSALASPVPESILEAYGSQGSLRYNFGTDEIHAARNGDPWEPLPVSPELEREWSVESDFIAAIHEGRDVHPDFNDGVKYMEFTEAVFRSVESGMQVDLPLSES